MKDEVHPIYIYIRLGDPFFEEVLQHKFMGLIVEKDGHTFKITTAALLSLLRDQSNKVWDEAIEEQQRNE